MVKLRVFNFAAGSIFSHIYALIALLPYFYKLRFFYCGLF